MNGYEASFLDRLERIGSFGGKADQMNSYFTDTGDPNYFNEDLGRYKSLNPVNVQAITQTYLPKDRCVILSVVPQGKTDLAAPNSQVATEESAQTKGGK